MGKCLMILAILYCFLCPFHASKTCGPSSFLTGTEHSGKSGKQHPQYLCSPQVSKQTSAHMTINSFGKGGDGGGPSACDNRYHEDSEMVVALSTGWFNGGSRCLKNININANGRTVRAKVVDECDSVNGCDREHDFQPPCPNNIVDASPAVWKALGVQKSKIGDLDITWSDA